MIKVLQTSYNGYEFRSRVEARWAMYFDGVGIQYSYEPVGVELSNGDKYLPDFYLPQLGMWAEVKGGDFDSFDFDKAKYLCIDSGKPIILLEADPDTKAYSVILPGKDEGTYIVRHANLFTTGEESESDLVWGKFLKGAEAYSKEGPQGEKAAQAVKEARACRFGIYQKKKKLF